MLSLPHHVTLYAGFFNIRAQDLEYSPLIMSKSIIHSNGACYIFSDQKKLKNENLTNKIKVFYRPIKDFDNHFSKHKDSIKTYLCAPNGPPIILLNQLKKMDQI